MTPPTPTGKNTTREMGRQDMDELVFMNTQSAAAPGTVVPAAASG